MLKKCILSIALLISLIVAVPSKAQAAYADGAAIGVAILGGFPAHASLGITGKFDGLPVMFGLTGRASFGNNYNYFGIGLTADWWGLKIPLSQSDVGIHFYLGPGGAFDADFGSKYWSINAALRMPIGFSFIFAKSFELFLELAPSINIIHAGSYGVQVLGLYIGNSGTGWGADGFFGFGAGLGFRYWF